MSSPLFLSARKHSFPEGVPGARHKIAVYEGLAELPSDIDELFRAVARRGGFFLSRQWFENLAAHGGLSGAVPRLYALHRQDDGKPCLLLPTMASSDRFGTRTLSALSNWYTSFYAPIAAADSGNLTQLQRMLHCIENERPRWDRLEFRPMDADSPLLPELVDALRSSGMAVQRYFCFVNWYLRVDGRSYEDYARGLPSPLRNTLKRKGKQLERSGRARFSIVTGADGQEALENGIAAYEAVYRNSWKSPEPTPEFMPSLIRLCAREGWLRLGLAHIDGEPAAAQLWIVCDGVASIYKLAYDERHAALSLGSLLTARMMQQAIDVDRVREVDYLTGDDAYKRDWMSHSRERHGIVAYNLRSARGLALAAANIGGGRLRKWLRRIRGERGEAA